MTALTPEQIAVVKATVPVLHEHGARITETFYRNMIGENASLRDVFSKTDQETGRQPRALAGAVLASAVHIEDLSVLAPVVERIVQRHVSLGVVAPQYDIVGTYLIAAISQVLGDAATPAILDAWTAAYGAIAKLFIDREAEVYRANEAEHWVGWRAFRIARKVAESSSVVSLYLAPSNGAKLPTFLPGQYVSVQLYVPEYGHLQTRQYSLSAAPRAEGDYYRISVKRQPAVGEGNKEGIISNMLHSQFHEGDEIKVSHPQGEFFLDPRDATKAGAPAVLISAGVGITPTVSMLGALAPASGEPAVKRPVSWIHATRSSAVMPFGEEVRQATQAHGHASAHIFVKTLEPDDKEGVQYQFASTRLDLDRLDGEKDLHLGNPRAEYFICGPTSFMVAIKSTLLAKGVSPGNIHIELFGVGDLE